MGPWNLESAVIPVTGGASGIGLAICRRLRAEGARPLLLDVDSRRIEAAVREVYHDLDETSASRHGYAVDVRDSQAVDACLAAIRRDHGLVTHAVANAGMAHADHVLNISDEQWHRVIAVNLHGVFYFCRAAARQMVEAKRGAIVTMGSLAGLRAKEERVAYAASKAAVINLTRALALDLGRAGIRVNSVAPGVIQTPMQDKAAVESLDASKRRTALGRLGTPVEVANLVLFLLSDLAGYITGETVVIDGGMTARYN